MRDGDYMSELVFRSTIKQEKKKKPENINLYHKKTHKIKNKLSVTFDLDLKTFCFPSFGFLHCSFDENCLFVTEIFFFIIFIQTLLASGLNILYIY